MFRSLLYLSTANTCSFSVGHVKDLPLPALFAVLSSAENNKYVTKREKSWLNTCLWLLYTPNEWDEGGVRDKDKWRWMSEIYIISCVNPSHVCPRVEGRQINTETLAQTLEFTFLLSLSSTSKKKHCEFCENQREN